MKTIFKENMEDRANILREMKVCRFCLCTSDEEELTNIHDKNIKPPEPVSIPLPSLSLQIMACTAIEVVKNDNMPQFICKTCHNLTTQAYIFKSNCRKTDDALKLFLVTGQLSKPFAHNVVQIKVQPAKEKTIEVICEPVPEEKSIQETERDQSVPGNSIIDEHTIVLDDATEEDSLQVDHQNQSGIDQIATECFSCTECERSFPLQQLLDIHMKNHIRERNFECSECHNKYFSKYDLQKHLLTHNPEKEYSCVVCSKTFNRESILRRHEKTHTNAPKYVCIKCDKTFLTKEYLDFHMEKHNKKRPFTCKICMKSFVFKQGLERHEVVHSENKPHKCNYCDASFTSAIKLTRHITSHAGLRPYPCKLCGRTFLLSHHLTRHMRSHYTISMTLDSVGQHKCDICSMSFQRKDLLINHSAIHSMVNLKCVICNTSFESANLVKEHITTHLAGLPYPCEKCDYSFESEEQLEEHELKHAEMEYEDQIEKEIFSEVIMQRSREDGEEEQEDQDYQQSADEVEEGEVTEYTIEEVNDPHSSIRRSSNQQMEVDDNDLGFLKDEVLTEDEVEHEETGMEDADIETIRPIVRPEGTKMYQRTSTYGRQTSNVRSSSVNPAALEKQQQTINLTQQEKQDVTNLLNGEIDINNLPQKIGDKVVKVQKFILTKEKMKAMAKKGLIEVKNGKVVMKSGSQNILNASIKPVQKTEIDSLLDMRQDAVRQQRKTYDKKNLENKGSS